MSELASNNPFRDMTSLSRSSPEPVSLSRSSKNPFLDASFAMDRRTERASDPSVHGGGEKAATRSDHSRRKKADDYSAHRTDSEKATRSGRTERPGHSPSILASKKPSRPRSNSETSALDLKKERSDRDKRREKSAKASAPSKPRKHLDKIDLLDVTGFAVGGGFHHDGPFDACTSHRNKNIKKAPVLAFAKDSTAMSLAAGPPTQPVYFGDHLNNVESFADYGNAGHHTRPNAGVRSTSFNTTSNIDPIHGYESVGLGSTTFLEGAPASRSAMLARTASDNGARSTDPRPRATSDYASNSALGRKKSVLQKIRGAYRDRGSDSPEYSIAASPPSSPSKKKEKDNDYFSDAREQRSVKGPTTNITFQLTDDDTSTTLSPLYRPPSYTGGQGPSSGTNGLIKRVKSLRVSNKKRTE